MDLLVLMPIVPVYISPYLQDLFEIFSRVASWRYTCIKNLPEIQQTHVQGINWLYDKTIIFINVSKIEMAKF